MTLAQTLLQNKFTELRNRNSRYTLRAYARKLGLSSGALSEILSGKRRVSEKSATRIAERLGLPPDELSKLLANQRTDEKRPAAQSLPYRKIGVDQFHLIADWWHYAILNLVETDDFRSDTRWIADRLGLGPKIITAAVERLFRLEMLRKDVRDTWRRAHPRYETSEDIVSSSIQRSHLQDLDLVRDALETIGVGERDMSSLTIAVNPENLAAMKKFIRAFQDEFEIRFAAKKEPSPRRARDSVRNTTTNKLEVYRLSTQLFPLSKRPRSKGKK